MKLALLILTPILLASCGSSHDPEARVPVPPEGSDYGDKAWNDPSIGPRPGGALGQMMESQ